MTILILLLLGSLMTWGNSRSRGGGPSGVMGLALVNVIALVLMGLLMGVI